MIASRAYFQQVIHTPDTATDKLVNRAQTTELEQI